MKIYLDLKGSTGQGGFEGYGSVFFNIDKHGDVILPGAFRDSLPAFLNEGFIGGVGHDHDKPAGRFVKAYEDAHGLFVEGRFSDVASGKEARTLLLDGVVQKLSVGLDREGMVTSQASPAQLRSIWSKAGYTPTADDERRLKARKSIRVIHKAQLKEVSPVTIPANDSARILAVKSMAETPEEFNRFINTARRAAWKLAGVQVKAGRVLSGKNEMKLRAMVEVMTSVTEELNNLLMLVAQAPTSGDDGEGEDPGDGADEGAETEDQEQAVDQEESDMSTPAGKAKPEGKDKPKGKEQGSTDQDQLEEDDEFARQRGKGGKGFSDLETKHLRDEALKLSLIAGTI